MIRVVKYQLPLVPTLLHPHLAPSLSPHHLHNSCLCLACAWPHFREDVLLDDSTHSELTPTNAPSWWLSVQRRRKRPLCKLQRLLRNFMKLCHTTSDFKELLGEHAYIDEVV